MPHLSRQRRITLTLVATFLAVGFAWYVSSRPMDFRVYYHGAEGVLNESRPVYGNYSGMGWPMHYRYPPIFLFLAMPFTLLLLSWASAVWTFLKCGALFLLIRAFWRRLGPTNSTAAWLIPFLLAGPYVVEDLRYGNAQGFIFALTAAALLLLPRARLLAAAALALAISIKVWPLYFLPYLAVRREWKVVGATLALTAILLLLPSLYFGVGGNAYLLSRWTQQEISTQTGQTEIWFQSQSLRGVMMRYLTLVDYSVLPDPNYPVINIASVTPDKVRALWIALAGIGYLGLLLITARRHSSTKFGLTEALAFTGLTLLQPFSQKYSLVVLLWPAMVAGRVVGGNRARGLLYAAIALTLAQPLISGSAAQRLMQVIGFDFLATALLAAFLVASIFASPTER